MSEPFLAEIRIVGFNFAPRGWALCDGQILPINQHQSLYSLLGTIYGGDGRTTFALPDFRGRTPIHAGSSGGPNYAQGQKGGEETHTLTEAELAAHQHGGRGSDTAADTDYPDDCLPAVAEGNTYRSQASGGNTVQMAAVTTGTGGGQGHNNMQPYLVLNFVIALQGIFPSRD